MPTWTHFDENVSTARALLCWQLKGNLANAVIEAVQKHVLRFLRKLILVEEFELPIRVDDILFARLITRDEDNSPNIWPLL